MPVSVQTLLQPADEPLTLAEAKLACRIDSDQTFDEGEVADAISDARTYIESWLPAALISRTVLITWDRFPRYSQWGGSGTGSGLMYQSEGLYDQRIPVTENAQKAWPDKAAFRGPIGPLQSVVALQYTDLTNTLQTLDATSYRIDYLSDPWRITPTFGNIWPYIIQQTQSVKAKVIVGYGPVTSIASAITVTGSQIVTPGSMYGIYAQDTTTDPAYAGTTLAIGTGTNREMVTVTAVTATTHLAGVTVRGGYPPAVMRAMKMLVAHWYRNREAVTPGNYGEVPMAVESLLWSVRNGEYT